MNWTLCTTRGSLALADSGPQALTVPARGLPGTAGSSVVLASAIRVCAGHTTGRVWAQPLPVGLGVQGHHDGHRRRGAHEVPEPVARRLRTRIRVSGSAHRTVTRHCGKEPTGSLRRPLTRRDSAEAAAWEDTVTVTNFEGTVTSGWHPGCESVFFASGKCSRAAGESYLSIKDPLTRLDPVHPQMPSRLRLPESRWPAWG
jgi:hypothetical protein